MSATGLTGTPRPMPVGLRPRRLDGVPSPTTAAPTAPAKQAHNLRAVLGQRGFRRLMGVRIVSQVADGWFQAGLAFSVLFNPNQNAGALSIAAGFAVLLLPYSLIGPYVGVFLDRWSRRSILFVANMLRAILVVPSALLIWHGVEGVPFFVLAFLIIAINRFFLAGLSASLPHVVDDRRLVTANALAGTLGSICFSIGLGVAVLLLNTVVPATFHGYATIASMAMLGYASSALLARNSFEPLDLGPDRLPRAGLLHGLVESGRGMMAGLRHLRGRRGALFAMLAQSAHRVLFGVLGLGILLFYRGQVDPGQDVAGSLASVGAVFLAGSVGVLLAAFLTPPVSRRIGGWRWIALLLTAEGAVVLAAGLPMRSELLVAAVFFVNLASQGIKIVVDTDLQHECADEYRGRVFSVNDTAFNICFVIGMFVGAVTLAEDGRSPEIIAAVAISLVLLAGWYAVVAGRWARRVGDDIAEPERSAALVG